MAVDLKVFLPERHRLARGHKDLFAHQVDTENTFRNRVFDLKSGVHFDEVELAVLIEKLDGAGADIVDVGHGIRTDLADPGAGFGVDGGAGRFLEHLLVTALQGTIPLARCTALPLPSPKT